MILNMGQARLLRSDVKVVAKPGKEDKQGVLLREAIIHDCDRSGRPQQGAQQSDLQTEKFPRDPENYNGGKRPEDDIGQTNRKFVGYRTGASRSAVPDARGGQGN